MKRKRFYTASELAGDCWWDEKFQARISRGGSGVKWDSARMTLRGGTIRLMRLDPIKLRSFRRYVPLDQCMELVKK